LRNLCPASRGLSRGGRAQSEIHSKESRPRRPGFDLPQEEATKPPDRVSPVSTHHSTIRYQVVENMNRRTAEPQNVEVENIVLFLPKTSAVRNFLFDLPAIASRSGEAGGYSIFKTG
jgi:hypothetical protein